MASMVSHQSSGIGRTLQYEVEFIAVGVIDRQVFRASGQSSHGSFSGCSLIDNNLGSCGILSSKPSCQSSEGGQEFFHQQPLSTVEYLKRIILCQRTDGNMSYVMHDKFIKGSKGKMAIIGENNP
nr:hypothetical protein [Azospira oryzae]